MNSKIQFLPINWRNGMSFSEDHLTSQYLAIADAMRDSRATTLNQFNYGLLGGAYQRRSADSFVDSIGTEKIQIHYCRAITQNGSRIEILDQDWPELHRPLVDLTAGFDLSKSQFWYLLLIVDPFTRIAHGEVNEQESPRRQPFTRPAYHLELISEVDIQLDNLANAIPLAQFEYTASGIRKVDDYIPPCTSLNSFDKLISKYEIYDQYLHQIREHAEQIMEKIQYKRKSKKEQNRLADDIFDLCNSYRTFFVDHYDAFRLLFRDLPPIYLMQFFAKLARKLSHTLDMGYDRTHVLKYFNQYATHLSVPEMGDMLTRVFTQRYHHYDMMKSLGIVDNMVVSLEGIFKALRDLDYRELAPRRVVTDDRIVDPQRPIRYESGGGMRIKRPGKSENLGDELRD